MPLLIPNCIRCKHMIIEEDAILLENGYFTKRCEAFPNGIPIEIFRNKIEHNKPYPGDNGIQFELSNEFKEYKPIPRDSHLKERRSLTKSILMTLKRKFNLP